MDKCYTFKVSFEYKEGERSLELVKVRVKEALDLAMYEESYDGGIESYDIKEENEWMLNS